MALIIRPMYSNPPLHGMRIAKRILGSPALFAKWTDELKIMVGLKPHVAPCVVSD